jgi:hypothetical protein
VAGALGFWVLGRAPAFITGCTAITVSGDEKLGLGPKPVILLASIGDYSNIPSKRTELR